MNLKYKADQFKKGYRNFKDETKRDYLIYFVVTVVFSGVMILVRG